MKIVCDTECSQPGELTAIQIDFKLPEVVPSHMVYAYLS